MKIKNINDYESSDFSDLPTWRTMRNIACEFLEPLFQLDIDLVSLQKGEEALDEMKYFLGKYPSYRLINYSDEIKDFSDTAALIENVDLVISVANDVVIDGIEIKAFFVSLKST